MKPFGTLADLVSSTEDVITLQCIKETWIDADTMRFLDVWNIRPLSYACSRADGAQMVEMLLILICPSGHKRRAKEKERATKAPAGTAANLGTRLGPVQSGGRSIV